MWQQEQIDIAPYNFNFVQTLKGKDVPVELAIPTTGPVGWATSLHLVANAAEPDLAVQIHRRRTSTPASRRRCSSRPTT